MVGELDLAVRRIGHRVHNDGPSRRRRNDTNGVSRVTSIADGITTTVPLLKLRGLARIEREV